jgi:hypothetical protein
MKKAVILGWSLSALLFIQSCKKEDTTFPTTTSDGSAGHAKITNPSSASAAAPQYWILITTSPSGWYCAPIAGNCIPEVVITPPPSGKMKPIQSIIKNFEEAVANKTIAGFFGANTDYLTMFPDLIHYPNELSQLQSGTIKLIKKNSPFSHKYTYLAVPAGFNEDGSSDLQTNALFALYIDFSKVQG